MTAIPDTYGEELAGFTRLSRDESLPSHERRAFKLAAMAYQHESTRQAAALIVSEVEDLRYQCKQVASFTDFPLDSVMLHRALRWKLHKRLIALLLAGNGADRSAANALLTGLHREFKQ